MVAGNIGVELNLVVGKINCYSNVANINNITYSALLPNIITAKNFWPLWYVFKAVHFIC